MEHYIVPVPKPRMTRADRWRKRPSVLRYFEYKDKVKLLEIAVPENGATVVFHMPMPKSWSKKKRAEMDGKPHQQKPDVDNLGKALLDAVYCDDACVWDIRFIKLWSVDGRITLK